MKYLFSIIILIAVCGAIPVKANVKGSEVIDTGSVKEQLDYIIDKSTTYQEYKVIRLAWVRKLRSHVVDSLNKSKSQYLKALDNILIKQDSIDALNLALGKADNKIAILTQEKNSVNLFGRPMSKSGYNSLMWGLVLVLAGVVSVLYLLFTRSNRSTIKLKKELEELNSEFDSHKKRAREREEKMARRHLDEILKYKNKFSHP